MPYNKGDFTEQGVNGDVSALVRLNDKRVVKMVLSSDDESSNVDVQGTVYDYLNGESYSLGGSTPTGLGDLLKSENLGTLTTSSTSDTSTGKTVTLDNYNDYQFLVFVIYVTTIPETAQHLATISTVGLNYANGVTAVATSAGTVMSRFNLIYDGSKIITAATSSSNVGIYPTNISVINDGTTLSIPLNYKYNSGTTNTIDADYNVDIYGVNLTSLFTE